MRLANSSSNAREQKYYSNSNENNNSNRAQVCGLNKGGSKSNENINSSNNCNSYLLSTPQRSLND